MQPACYIFQITSVYKVKWFEVVIFILNNAVSKALSLLGSCWENTSTDRLSIPSCDQEKPPFIIGSTSLLWAHWLWQNCTVNHDLNSKTGVVTAQPYKNHVNSVRPHAQITKPRKFSIVGDWSQLPSLCHRIQRRNSYQALEEWYLTDTHTYSNLTPWSILQTLHTH